MLTAFVTGARFAGAVFVRNAEARTVLAGFLTALAGSDRLVLPPDVFAAFLAGDFFDLTAVTRAAFDLKDSFAPALDVDRFF
ncbi:MAG: hypothetical protein Q7T86_08520 [Hyphomicrobiaceae bacterium]|nr:hypothetical protein [Hyphomicrobiaceae bacterium]